MTGLIIRLALLCSVVFAVVYAVTRSLRANAASKQAQRIADEIRALRAAILAEEMDPTEYAVVAERIRRDCEQLGIPAPELPHTLSSRRKPKD